MKVWVFVEGNSDRLALSALWKRWIAKLRNTGWGIEIIPLDDKSRYFRKIGHRVAEKLVHNSTDLEVLVLASIDALRSRLKTKEKLGSWRQSPEDQNQFKPPKRVVEELFRKFLKRAYRETVDTPAIMSDSTLTDVIFDETGAVQCPEFKRVIDWIKDKTDIIGY